MLGINHSTSGMLSPKMIIKQDILQCQKKKDLIKTLLIRTKAELITLQHLSDLSHLL